MGLEQANRLNSTATQVKMAGSDDPDEVVIITPADHLSTAAARGDIKEVRKLLEAGVDVNERNSFGRTALQVMNFSQVSLATLLLEAGADPNVVDHSKNNKIDTLLTPAHDVARQGYLDTLKVLLWYGADISLLDARGNTPAHLAARYGHYEILNYLAEGVDLRLPRNQAGLSPLDVYERTKAGVRHQAWILQQRASPATLKQLACHQSRHLLGKDGLRMMHRHEISRAVKSILLLQY